MTSPDIPIISIIIFDYYPEYLAECLNKIFNQDIIDDLEVIYFDNSSIPDKSWELVNSYALQYNGYITIKKGRSRSSQDTLKICVEIAKGTFIVQLNDDDRFDPQLIKEAVDSLNRNPHLSRYKIFRKSQFFSTTTEVINDFADQPLVSILIHNWNYGRFLRHCLESVFKQTYTNIEVIFSDNASDDNSWQIANEFADKYPGKMTIVRNRKNFGPADNQRNCYLLMNGKYYCCLCSDDFLAPEFVEQCVCQMEKHRDVAYVITHCTVVDEHNHPLPSSPPFYNQSCFIPGSEQAAVYMMAAVNASISQLMYCTEKAKASFPNNTLTDRWFDNRIHDFLLCCKYPMIYLRDPLVFRRHHCSSDSSTIAKNLIEIFGQYLLIHQFADTAANLSHLYKVVERLPAAVTKLSKLCLRYSVNALEEGAEETARRYYFLAPAIAPQILTDTTYTLLSSYWNTHNLDTRQVIKKQLVSTDNLTVREISYSPPENAKRLAD